MTSVSHVFSVIVEAGARFGSFTQQVDEGDVNVVNIRETDGRLGPLILILVILGVVTLLATVGYWWATRPPRTTEPQPSQGDLEDV